MIQEDARRWAAGLEAVVAWIAPRFGRVEPRRRALAYLLDCCRRRSARTAGSWPSKPATVRPTGCRTFCPGCTGEAELVRDDLRAYVAAHLVLLCQSWSFGEQ